MRQRSGENMEYNHNQPVYNNNQFETRDQIRDWIETEPFREMLSYVQSRVQGQEEVAAVAANVYNYLLNVAETGANVPNNQTKSNCNNMLLCAPSGCGKTETFRAIKDYFAEKIPLLPVHIVDVSGITPNGYRGPEPCSIVEPFINGGPAPVGIVFMDEFDKICTPGNAATRFDLHLEVQHNLLTIIEGSNVETRQGIVNSKNLLFIGMGSFDAFRQTRENENKAGIGFGNGEETEETEHAAPVTRENMITAGGCHELIGRFAYIVNYHKLNGATIQKIIENNCSRIAQQFRCDLVLSVDAVSELFESANSKFGCRLLDSLIRENVLKAYCEAIQENKQGDVLVIKLDKLDSYSYLYRDFTGEEKRYNACRTAEAECKKDNGAGESGNRVNLEETLQSMIQTL